MKYKMAFGEWNIVLDW